MNRAPRYRTGIGYQWGGDHPHVLLVLEILRSKSEPLLACGGVYRRHPRNGPFLESPCTLPPADTRLGGVMPVKPGSTACG